MKTVIAEFNNSDYLTLKKCAWVHMLEADKKASVFWINNYVCGSGVAVFLTELILYWNQVLSNIVTAPKSERKIGKNVPKGKLFTY